jgi:signal transduction histidine kinase/ActR/RegA family two-component response regulator
MSIGRRLAFGLALLLTIIVGFVALVRYGQEQAQREFHVILEDTEPRAAKARLFSRAVFNSALAIRTYLAFPDAAYRLKLDESIQIARDALRTLEDDTARSEDVQMVMPLRGMFDAYLVLGDRFIERSLAGEADVQIEREMTLHREQLLASSRRLTDVLDGRADAGLRDVERSLVRASRVALWAGVIALILFVALGWLIARSITRPVAQLLHTVRRWQGGDTAAALSLRGADDVGRTDSDELRVLSRAFGEAASAIDRRERRMLADANVGQAMATSLDVRELGQRILKELADPIGAAAGLLYRWSEDEGALIPIAGHAIAPAESRLAPGEGLPGQAASQRTTVVLRDIPANGPLNVKLGYDQVPPRCAVAVPIVFGRELVGVLVLASLHDIDAESIGFLESSARLIAISLRNAYAHERIVELLADVRERSREITRANESLQAQAEELQAQNEEIQSQSEELQVQNEEIQAQHEELQAQNDQLGELADALRSRVEEVAEVDRRKTDFLAVLAHELRNPMAPIVTSLALLRRVCPDSEHTATALQAIDRQSAHLTRLIEDLLDITRISRGKVELQRQPTDLVDLVQSCVHDQRDTIDAKRLSLDVRLPSAPVIADVDADRVIQAVMNLLHNAAKFTPVEGRIEVALERHDNEVAITVADNGIGIEPELQAQLFVPFSQGPSGLDRRHGGLGLGLALVKGLVEQHGGRVEMHSDGVDTGSRFTLLLPALTADLPDAAEESQRGAAAVADAPKASPKSLRVLVVDDNADAATVLRMALEWEDHIVREVADGRDVEAAARAFQPDVILCDIGLPGIDGYEVARRLRADPKFSDTLLIALTGYASVEDRDRSRAAGFDDHLAKPVDFERLNQALRQVSAPAPVDTPDRP